MASEVSRVRSAALALHGLPEGARRSVLAGLPAEQRAAVEPLLRELAELGVPAVSPARIAEQVERGTRGREQDLDELEPSVVVGLLAQQSASTVAALLRARAWRWKQEVLDRLPAPQRDLVRRQLDDDELPRAVSEAYVEAFSAAVREQQHAAHGVVHVSFWRRWWPWKR